MPKPSSIKRLPPDVREAVDKAIREGRATIAELVALIDEHGGKVSKSAVGRYRKRAEDQMARYRQAQEIAKVWVGKLEADPQGDVGRLLSEMLKTIAFQVAGEMGDSAEAVGPREVMFLADALKSMGQFDRARADLTLRLRKEIAAEAAATAGKAAKKAGLTTDAVDAIKRDILGIAK